MNRTGCKHTLNYITGALQTMLTTHICRYPSDSKKCYTEEFHFESIPSTFSSHEYRQDLLHLVLVSSLQIRDGQLLFHQGPRLKIFRCWGPHINLWPLKLGKPNTIYILHNKHLLPDCRIVLYIHKVTISYCLTENYIYHQTVKISEQQVAM
jgi:hypothetical protein